MDQETRDKLDELSRKTDEEIAAIDAERSTVEAQAHESPNDELKKGVLEDTMDRILGISR